MAKAWKLMSVQQKKMHKVHHHSLYDNTGIVLCRFLTAKKSYLLHIWCFYQSKVLFLRAGAKCIPARHMSLSSVSFFIFSGSCSFILFKSTNKVAKIIKTIAISNICYGIVRCGKLVTCLLNTLTI